MFGSHTKDRSQLRRTVAVLALTGLVLAACANSSDDDTADATTPATDAPAASVAETVPEDTAATISADTAATTPEDTTVATTAPDDTAPDLGEFQPITGVPGVTDDEIGFGVISTGAANPLGYCLLDCYVAGVQAYFDYRNGLGGVHGRDLVINRVDDDELANNQVKALETIGDDTVFGAFMAPVIDAGLPDLAASGMPVYTVFQASPEANGLDNVYVPSGTVCVNCPRRHDIKVAQLAGATKVAALGFGIAQASKDCVANKEATFEQWGPEVGIEFVYSNSDLAFGLPNGIAPEVTAMKDAGVDFILTCVDQSTALQIAQELERQGMSDVTMMLPQGYGDSEFLSNNAALLEGDLLGTAFRPFEAETGDTMLATMSQYLEASGATMNDVAVQGWLGAELAVTGMLAAGPQFDRTAVVAATNQITDWTAGGLVPPVDWSRQHTAPTVDDPVTNGPVYDCSAYLIVTSGALTLSGDPAKPFFCFDPADQESVEPTPMTFS